MAKNNNAEYADLKRTTQLITDALYAMLNNFERMNKILFILLRRQSRMEYQIDKIDDIYFFRIHSENTDLLHKYHELGLSILKYKIVLFNDTVSYNYCPVSSIKNNILQFEIQFPPVSLNPSYQILNLIFVQTMTIFYKLPKKSAAVKSDIPMLYNSTSEFW